MVSKYWDGPQVLYKLQTNYEYAFCNNEKEIKQYSRTTTFVQESLDCYHFTISQMAEMESFLFMLSNSYFPNKNTSGIALLLSWNSLEIDLSDWSDTLSGMEIKMAGTRC